jgi:hypothetical protein
VLDFILDAIDISQLSTFYISILLSLAVQYLFILSIDVSMDSISTSIDINSQSCISSYIAKSRENTNHILVWIIKYIRKKESSGDDGDHYIFSY